MRFSRQENLPHPDLAAADLADRLVSEPQIPSRRDAGAEEVDGANPPLLGYLFEVAHDASPDAETMPIRRDEYVDDPIAAQASRAGDLAPTLRDEAGRGLGPREDAFRIVLRYEAAERLRVEIPGIDLAQAAAHNLGDTRGVAGLERAYRMV